MQLVAARNAKEQAPMDLELPAKHHDGHAKETLLFLGWRPRLTVPQRMGVMTWANTALRSSVRSRSRSID